MEPNTAKTLGGIGSILAILGINIVGYILVLIGLRSLGEYYNDENLKRDSLKWFIWGIVSAIATAIFIAILSWTFDTATSMNPSAALSIILAGLLIGTIITLIVAEIFNVISAIYLKRAYTALAVKSGEDLFNTAAKLYFWGSALTIVLVGLIIIWISWIISAIAFFSMKPRRLGTIA